jgi:tetratricopeptide (TPR) repeat protein
MVAAAESLIDIGLKDEAAALLDRAMAVTPFDWRVHYLYGVAATLEGRPAAAVASLRVAAELAPGPNATILNPLANALLASGAYAEAAIEAKRAIAIQPLAPEHHLVRGKALLALGNSAEAREAFRYSAQAYRGRLARGEPASGPLAESEEGLAFALLDEARIEDAEQALQRLAAISAPAADRAAMRLAPWLSQSGSHAPLPMWKFAVDALIEEGSVERAEEIIEWAIAAHPDFADEFVPADARVSLARGRPDEALVLLQNASNDAKSIPEFQLALAMTHAALGNSATAALEFDALLNRRDLPPGVRRQALEAEAALP